MISAENWQKSNSSKKLVVMNTVKNKLDVQKNVTKTSFRHVKKCIFVKRW